MERDVQRVQLLRQLMAAQGYEALVLRAPANVLMASGYLPRQGDSFCFVRQAGQIILLVPREEASRASASWADRVLIFDRLVEGVLQPAGEGALAYLRSVLGAYDRLAKIGYEHGPLAFPAYGPEASLPDGGSADILRAAGYAATWHDCADLTEAAAMWKSAAELRRVRRAATVAVAGLSAARELVASGNPAGVIQGAALGAMAAAAPEDEVVPFCQVQCRDACVVVAVRVAVNGMWAAASRTFFLGQPTATHQRDYELVGTARAAALAAISNGVVGSEVDQAARAVFAAAGQAERFPLWTGHGVGFHAEHPLARPIIAPGSVDTLRPTMTFTLAPAAAESVVIEDTVALTGRGVEVLTDFPTELTQLTVPAA
ncbi:MAG: hypothetical protein KatS3mg061_1284 [Dehalococcoidia bacterium]|nr:MAG: hypothetical protein KatS3mg061_1284 [Dehalococcoidia bacterium]